MSDTPSNHVLRMGLSASLKKAILENVGVSKTLNQPKYIEGLGEHIREMYGYEMDITTLQRIFLSIQPALIDIGETVFSIEDNKAYLETATGQELLMNLIQVLRFALDQFSFLGNVHALALDDGFATAKIPTGLLQYQQSCTLFTENYSKAVWAKFPKVAAEVSKITSNLKVADEKKEEFPVKPVLQREPHIESDVEVPSESS